MEALFVGSNLELAIIAFVLLMVSPQLCTIVRAATEKK